MSCCSSTGLIYKVPAGGERSVGAFLRIYHPYKKPTAVGDTRPQGVCTRGEVLDKLFTDIKAIQRTEERGCGCLLRCYLLVQELERCNT